MDQQLKNNSESEFAISQLNIRISKLRDQLNASSEAIQLAMNELIAMKRRVQHETNRLQQIRQHNQQMTIASAAQLKSNQKLKETVSELVEKVKKIQSGKNSSEGRLRYLDELFENEGKQVHEIETEMSRLSQMLYRSTQVLQEQQNEQKLLEVKTSSNTKQQNSPNLNSINFFRVRYSCWNQQTERSQVIFCIKKKNWLDKSKSNTIP